MKKHIVLYFMFSISFTNFIYSQNFEFNFPEMEWVESELVGTSNFAHHITVEEDTMIMNLKYDKIYSQLYCIYKNGTFSNVTCLENKKLIIGAIREENNRVYYLELDTTSFYYQQEYLLIDFNLNPNDIMNITENGLIFAKIHQVNFTEDGRKKVSMFISSFAFYDSAFVEWTQGVGCNRRLLYFKGAPQWETDCTLNNNNPNFPDYIDTECPCEQCFESITNVSNTTKDILNIYPNPTKNKLYIDFSNGISNYNYSIYTTQGMPIDEQENTLQEYIDLSKIPSGIYIVKIDLNKSKTTSIFKIIKQ